MTVGQILFLFVIQRQSPRNNNFDKPMSICVVLIGTIAKKDNKIIIRIFTQMNKNSMLKLLLPEGCDIVSVDQYRKDEPHRHGMLWTELLETKNP